MMIKAPSTPFVLAVAVLVVAAASGPPAAEATIESTCRAAAARDRRVNVTFCARQFAEYHGAAESDAWGLAQAAALIGVNLGDDALFDLTNGKIVPPPPPGKKVEAAMNLCADSYDAVGLAFADATDGIAERRYAAAKQKMMRVAALVQRCDGALARAGAAWPLPRYSADCMQMAIIGIAITDLIK